MIYQRIATWIINKISRTILKSAFVVLAFLITGKFVVSALAMLLMMFMTDFVKISLSTDNVRGSRTPETWDVPGPGQGGGDPRRADDRRGVRRCSTSGFRWFGLAEPATWP